jgi:hypothetical protein
VADGVPNTSPYFVVEPPWGSLTASEGSKQAPRAIRLEPRYLAAQHAMMSPLIGLRF